MHQMLCDVALDEAARRRLEALPGVTLRTLPPHERGWELQEDLLRGPEFLLCKLPPRNRARSTCNSASDIVPLSPRTSRSPCSPG